MNIHRGDIALITQSTPYYRTVWDGDYEMIYRAYDQIGPISLYTDEIEIILSLRREKS